MITLLGSLLGFGSSIFPSILQFFQDSKDKKHELRSMEMQMQLMDKKAEVDIKQTEVEGEMEAIRIELLAEMESIKGAHRPMVMTGNKWIDAYRSSVRPTVSYWFMGLYTYAKYQMVQEAGLEALWTQMDQALFATIISFWFGDRIRKYYHPKQ